MGLPDTSVVNKVQHFLTKNSQKGTPHFSDLPWLYGCFFITCGKKKNTQIHSNILPQK